MSGLTFQENFTPKSCRKSIDGKVITAAAGSQMKEINQQAHLRNLTIVSGGAETVGVGGYLTGGGHAALSSTYGLGADQVLELEVVTPGGDILTINECQNRDLFWAFRGVSFPSKFKFSISLVIEVSILTDTGRRLNIRCHNFRHHPCFSLHQICKSQCLSWYRHKHGRCLLGYYNIYSLSLPRAWRSRHFCLHCHCT